MIDVSGVRRSCETARRRLPRIFSISASRRMRSCSLICVVMALVVSEATSMLMNVSG